VNSNAIPLTGRPEDGTHEEIEGQHVLSFERRLRHSIERVWAAITEPEELRAWLARAEIEPREGGRIALEWENSVTADEAARYGIEGVDTSGEAPTMQGTITRFDPPRLIEYDTDIHGTLRWELREDPAGCVLSFINTLPPVDETGRAQALAGWHIHLDLLDEALAGGQTDWANWPIERWAEIRDHYAEAIAARAYKTAQRQNWSGGDWSAVAPAIQGAADTVVAELGIAAGHDVLDVATGNGNAAIAAAARGARVVGLDLVPELLEAAGRRAEETGVNVEWVVGDADVLPFDDDSFDRVTSIFGAIFAFDHRGAAAELVRVARPGGAIGVTSWTPEGMNGRIFEAITSFVEPPPSAQNPMRWGDEDYVRGLFAELEVEVGVERRTIDTVWASSEAWVDHQASNLGPMMAARTALEEAGSWAEARAALVEVYERHNRSGDGTLRAPAEYLLVTVRK
jgi:SAM-dependent methyltransferase